MNDEHVLDLWARVNDALATELHCPGASGMTVADALELAETIAHRAIAHAAAAEEVEVLKDRIARLLEPIPILGEEFPWHP